MIADPPIETGPTYSPQPLPRRHRPPQVSGKHGYQKYRRCLRIDFAARCAYCLSHETEVGQGYAYGGFEIDHFRPSSIPAFARLLNEYPNLHWSCAACNRSKRALWPSPHDVSRGAVFVDPCAEGLARHLRISGQTVLANRTSAAGEYMIRMLRLNSPYHTDRRRRRTDGVAQIAKVLAVAASLARRAQALPDGDPERLRLTVEAETLFADCRNRLQLIRGQAPRDMPKECICVEGGAGGGAHPRLSEAL